MASQINPNNINGGYPVAGQDNNSQGFRDNFTNTATNFQYAANEITDLQNKAVLKTALAGTTLNNDMLGAPLSNALFSDIAWKTVPIGTISGSVAIDYAAGSYQSLTMNASVSIGFTNWPVAGQTGVLQLAVTVPDTTRTLTLPAAASLNNAGIQGINTTTNVIRFAATGVYVFQFTTSDGGSTIYLSEVNKTLQPFSNTSDVPTSALSLATSTSVFAGAGSYTLAAGVPGQVKVLVQTQSGSAVVNVTGQGWGGGSGTITLSAQGQACTLMYVSNTWVCIGNNGAVFG